MKKASEIFIFIGPPGAGKGSLSSLCTRRFGWQQLSTGNLCRQHIADQTEIGKQIDFAIKSGKLISDSLIIDMVGDWIVQNAQNGQVVILDGFPRTIAQAQALDELLEKAIFSSVQLRIVQLALTDEVVIARLSSRLICQNKICQAVYSETDTELAPRQSMTCNECEQQLVRRKDDEFDAIKERLIIYHRHAHDLLNYYRSTGRTIEQLAVERPMHEIFGTFAQLAGLELI